MSSKQLVLTLNTAEQDDAYFLQGGASSYSEWKAFADKYSNEITTFCSIDPDTEHQLDNFGPGSAWLYESPYKFIMEYDQNMITLTIPEA